MPVNNGVHPNLKRPASPPRRKKTNFPTERPNQPTRPPRVPAGEAEAESRGRGQPGSGEPFVEGVHGSAADARTAASSGNSCSTSVAIVAAATASATAG